MAQKQYSFDFILNAVLNGGFSATFTKAQQEFIRLGNEIRNLQAIQRDVNAYEKQQAAVQNTTAKLDNLRRQYELIKKQISETTGSTTALEREKLKLEQRIASTEGALEKQKEKLEGTTQRLDEAGVSTSDLAAKDAELTEKIKELTEEQKRAAEGAGEFKNKAAEAFEVVGSAVAAAGIATAVREITDAYRECVGVAADFGQAMSAAEAIADANRSEMTALTAEAKELGASTIYTAQQSAEGMEKMAMAGWNAQEMLSGMKGMTTLAAAAGEDLAQVSDIVTDNLSAFGLQASDTAHFADVLAAAAANSNTNIAIMGETFKSSSSVAGALGYSIEDVAVMVGMMANNSVKGSRAGTALRNIFNGLLDGVTLTAAAFGELDYSAVNSDGSMKGLMETVKDLRGYFNQMTEAEKVNNAMAIAGMRGYNGLLAILNATDEDFQSLYNSINNCSGAAERMAAVKLDNLAGDITLMNSATEALQTTIGEQFEPELRALTQTGTELLNWVNRFVQENPSLVKGIMAGTGAFAALGTTIVGVNAAIKIFKTLELATLFAGAAGPLLGITAGIAGVTAVTVGLVDAMRDGGPAVRELTEAARGSEAAMAEAKDTYDDTTVSTLASAEAAGRYIDKLDELRAKKNRLESAGEDINAVENEYQNTLAILLQLMPSLSECISQTTDEYGRSTYTLETTTDALRANTEEWKKNAQAQAYQEYYNSVMANYKDILLDSAEASVKLTMAQNDKETAEKKLEDTTARMNELEEKKVALTKEEEAEYANLQGDLIKYGSDLNDAENDILTYTRAVDDNNEALSEAEAVLAAVEEALGISTEELGANADAQKALSAEIDNTAATMESVKDKALTLADAYAQAYSAAYESFSGQFSLWEKVDEVSATSLDDLQIAIDSQISYWNNYNANLQILKDYGLDTSGVWDHLTDGSADAAAAAQGLVNALNSGDTSSIDAYVQSYEDLKEAIGETSDTVASTNDEVKKAYDELYNTVLAASEKLNMSEKFTSAANDTIQGYINGLGDGSEVGTILSEHGQAWISSLNAALGVASPSTKTNQSGRDTITGFVNGVDETASEGEAAMRRAAQAAIDEFNALMNSSTLYSAGRSAIQSAISGINAMTPSLVSAARSAGQQAASAMQRELSSVSLSTPSSSYGGNPGSLTYALGFYASGTDNAPPGWSWVGEEGPELMRLHGGEQILPADVSRRLAEDYAAYGQYTTAWGAQQAKTLEVADTGTTAAVGKVEVHVHVEAGASPETVDAWEQYARRGELKATILEVMEEADADMRRRVLR